MIHARYRSGFYFLVNEESNPSKEDENDDDESFIHTTQMIDYQDYLTVAAILPLPQ